MQNYFLKFFAVLLIQLVFLKTDSMAKLANEPVFFILSDSIPEINSLVNSEKKIKLFRFDFNNPEHIEMFRLKTQENKRITAFGLAIFLGHFGVHRLYLGTKPIVPITYVLTMGGGFGFIPLIDAIMILATKDLGKFENNSKYFMWIDME